MQKRRKARKKSFFWNGWNLALEAVWQTLAGMTDDSLTPDQKRLRSTLFDWLGQCSIDEDLLKAKPTNAQLATKYGVAKRTITNWRREGCEFEGGKWAVWSWLREQRIIPAGAKVAFAPQLARRTDEGLEETDDLAGQAAALLAASREWLRSRR